jgi:alkylation response protein AidB-like acyl-CoA dehydrogenase
VTYTAPLDDIRFLLRRIAPMARLAALARYAHVDAEDAERVLAEAARIAGAVIAPINAPGDEEGARLENGVVVTPKGYREAYAQLAAAGWTGLSLPVEHGGQGMPQLVQTVFTEMVSGASLAFGMSLISSVGGAKVIGAHAVPAQAAMFLPQLADGSAMATIVMTEPHAGSDIGLARTRATAKGDGTYALSGTKIFISYGDHDLCDQILHIVLARTPAAPPGIKGLSLFLVPKRLPQADGTPGIANRVRAARLEKKMGLAGSPTCEMLFEDATGWLLGREGDGIRNMFTMVNSMRLDVGAQSVGVAGAALAKAQAYVQERRQGGRGPDGGPVPLVAHADVRRQLMQMRAWTEGYRALLYTAALEEDIANAGAEAERGEARDLVEWLLPLIKAGGSDAAFRVANQAIQLHGGHGYVFEHGVEQLARDVRIAAIYEGANAIQAIDLVTRKLAQDNGRRAAVFAARIRADLAAARGLAVSRGIAAALEAALPALERATQYMLERVGAAQRDALAGASAYLELAATIAVGWMWLKMAAAADPAHPAEAAKPALANFFAEDSLSAADHLARRAMSGAGTIDALEDAKLLA